MEITKETNMAPHVADLMRRNDVKTLLWYLNQWSAKHGKESAEKLRQEARVMWRRRKKNERN